MHKNTFYILLALQCFTLFIISLFAFTQSNIPNVIFDNLPGILFLPILLLGPVLSVIFGIYQALTKKLFGFLVTTIVFCLIDLLLIKKIFVTIRIGLAMFIMSI